MLTDGLIDTGTCQLQQHERTPGRGAQAGNSTPYTALHAWVVTVLIEVAQGFRRSHSGGEKKTGHTVVLTHLEQKRSHSGAHPP